MNIDWFEIVFIVINFFILLFILQKIFYKPVLKVMAERQTRIDENLASAKRKEDEAENLIKSYVDKLNSLEKTKETLLREARAEAMEKKRKWLEVYQAEAHEKRQHYLNEVEEERETFATALQEQMVSGALSVASKLLEETKNEDWDQRLFFALIEKLKIYNFPKPLKELTRGESKLLLLSAEPLNEKKKKLLQDALLQSPFLPDSLTYREDSSLILGYELQMPSHTIYASIKNHLKNSQENLTALLDRTPYDEEN